MKFSFALVSSLAILSLAVSAAPLEERDGASVSNSTITPAPTSTNADAMHGAKATASISIIGAETHSSAGSTVTYASMSVIVPATIAAVMALA